MTRQGFPTATLLSGMSLVTTLPEPITTLLPMLTPGIICVPDSYLTFTLLYLKMPFRRSHRAVSEKRITQDKHLSACKLYTFPSLHVGTL